ncbi:MAG: M20/M25/M40 family metallo-hydrolase [Phycisphaerae bacterium]|nr:M20/M25/M40 family metallo-hydrolase [Phycisphaerae bacterium]
MGLSDRELKFARAVERRRDSLLEDLRLHVGLPTGMGNSPALDESRERFAARCRDLGAVCELIPGDPKPDWLDAWSRAGAASAPDGPPPTLVCRRAGPPGVPHALIAGHLDTVHDPHGSFRQLSIAAGGATATGPGCVDMKGGLVIAMAALEALAECGEPVGWTFMLNSDEETGSFCSDRALRAEAASGRYVAGLALEPAMSKGELAIERGGSGQFLIDCRGRAAHVGRDFAAGVSAVNALAECIVSAAGLSRPAEGVCVNVGPLRCTTPPNVVPDRAWAWGNVRFPMPSAGASLERQLAQLARDGLPHVAVTSTLNRPAKPMNGAVEQLGLLARGASEDLGRPLPFARTAGVCDGNNLQAAGLPTIDTLGVRGGGLHTTEEWVEIASLVERATLFGVILLRIGSGRLAIG